MVGGVSVIVAPTGAFVADRGVTVLSFKDGMSHTLLVGEKHFPDAPRVGTTPGIAASGTGTTWSVRSGRPGRGSRWRPRRTMSDTCSAVPHLGVCQFVVRRRRGAVGQHVNQRAGPRPALAPPRRLPAPSEYKRPQNGTDLDTGFLSRQDVRPGSNAETGFRTPLDRHSGERLVAFSLTVAAPRHAASSAAHGGRQSCRSSRSANSASDSTTRSGR